jgi:hypothetical protein
LNRLGWKPLIELQIGLKQAYTDFIAKNWDERMAKKWIHRLLAPISYHNPSLGKT